jgi:DNA-binding MarR family transcriptional regulator
MTPKPPPRFHPSEVDRVIHEPVRLGAMAILCAGSQGDFTFLKEALGATDGNLAAHLRTLEEAGYVEAVKRFVDRRPNTLYKATPAGKEAFLAYGRTMSRILPRETGNL